MALNTHELKNWGKAVKEQAATQNIDPGTLAEQRTEKMIKDGQIDPMNFSFGAAFEALVDPEGTLNRQDPVAVGRAIEASLLPRITQPLVSTVVKGAYDYEVGNLMAAFTEEDAKHSQFEDLVGLNSYSDLRYRKPGEAYDRGHMEDETYRAWYKDYGLILDIPMEVLMDDRNNLVVKRAMAGGEGQGKKLAQVLCQTIEMDTSRSAFEEGANKNTAYTRNGVSHFGRAAGSAVVSSPAYAFYASATHTYIDGQTNINLINDDFGSDGVKTANQYLQRMTDPRGRKISIRPEALIGHSVKWEEMTQFVTAAGRYDTLEPTPNVWRGQQLQIISSPYFTSEDYWFFGAPRKSFRIRWVERPNTVVMSGLTKDNFERRIVMSIRHNLYFGVITDDYRYLIMAAYATGA
jgi:hypothetical protein